MPQIINTNLPSINAQRNLDASSSKLATSLQRLSSGLRINSAKDDAAGLAIATRFTSRIQGLTQAQRNANDAISLSQVAEGALQETTRILQRSRELAIQAANGSNSAADRKALQAEVNQLKNELTRVATTTTFNGLDILNGELTNATFQIGSEANQTVTVSINDTRTSALGSNTLNTSNTNGIEQATHVSLVTGAGSTDEGIGTDIGVSSAGAGNNYIAELFTVTNTTSAGVSQTQTATFTSANDAGTIASNLSAVSGVTASAFNKVVLSDLDVASASDSSDSFSVAISINGASVTSEITIASETDSSFSHMAQQINADTDLASGGVYAISSSDSLQIFALGGDDIVIENLSSDGAFSNSFSALTGLRDDLTTYNALVSSTSLTFGGRVDVELDQGYSLQSNLAAIFGGTANINLSVQASGIANVSAGNVVTDQTLTISGSTGSASVNITANDEASAIVTAINAVTGTTNVKASAATDLTLQNLSANGTVSFSLFGDNTAAAAISAAITTNDFTSLIKAINDASGNTGISAATDGANNVIKLTHSTGKNIQLLDFEHSAAVDVQSVASSGSVIITGDGSSTTGASSAYIDAIGNSANNSGTTVRLYDGSTVTGLDSTVVGGQVKFTSSAAFSVTSSVDGSGFTGGIFGVAASAGNSSSLSTVASVDISTAAGAQSAIDVLDEAINQVSEVRADLGAIQSRFESAIRNLANNVENLNVARSRILDTDFAAETAELTKNNILTQAGVSILAQANALPQNVLALLQ